jgi:hypothetical protein
VIFAQTKITTDNLLNQHYARIARLRFDSGYTSYIEVLDAERSLFNAELSQAQTKGILFQALVNLCKATGGGWVMEAGRMGNRSLRKPSDLSTRHHHHQKLNLKN